MAARQNTFSATARVAETSTDPVASLLRDASDRLERDPPDVSGARLFVWSARLAHAHTLLAGEDRSNA